MAYTKIHQFSTPDACDGAAIHIARELQGMNYVMGFDDVDGDDHQIYVFTNQKGALLGYFTSDRNDGIALLKIGDIHNLPHHGTSEGYTIRSYWLQENGLASDEEKKKFEKDLSDSMADLDEPPVSSRDLKRAANPESRAAR